jgi:hypothetical protein
VRETESQIGLPTVDTWLGYNGRGDVGYLVSAAGQAIGNFSYAPQDFNNIWQVSASAGVTNRGTGFRGQVLPRRGPGLSHPLLACPPDTSGPIGYTAAVYTGDITGWTSVVGETQATYDHYQTLSENETTTHTCRTYVGDEENTDPITGEVTTSPIYDYQDYTNTGCNNGPPADQCTASNQSWVDHDYGDCDTYKSEMTARSWSLTANAYTVPSGTVDWPAGSLTPTCEPQLDKLTFDEWWDTYTIVDQQMQALYGPEWANAAILTYQVNRLMLLEGTDQNFCERNPGACDALMAMAASLQLSADPNLNPGLVAWRNNMFATWNNGWSAWGDVFDMAGTTFSYTGTAFAQGNWGNGIRGIGALYQEGFNMAWYGTGTSFKVVGGMAWDLIKTPYRIVTDTGPNTVNAWRQWQAGQVSGWEVLFHSNNLAGDVTAVSGTAYGVGKFALTRSMRGNGLGTFGMPDEMMPPRAAGGNVFEPAAGVWQRPPVWDANVGRWRDANGQFVAATRYYHATNTSGASSIRNGIDLSVGRFDADFNPAGSKGFYVTTDYPQAQDWANRAARKWGGAPEVLEFVVRKSELQQLNGKIFTGASQEWEQFVLSGRSGTLQHAFDYVEGPMLLNPDDALLGAPIEAGGHQLAIFTDNAATLFQCNLVP